MKQIKIDLKKLASNERKTQTFSDALKNRQIGSKRGFSGSFDAKG